jgi:cytochrome c553
MRQRFSSALLVIASIAIHLTPTHSRAEDKSIDTGKQLFTRCLNCHGPDAQGMSTGTLRVPSIAGLDAWYIEGQLNKFRTDLRGAHPDDTKGLMMRAMSRSLANDAEVKAVAAYVASLPRKVEKPDTTANLERGKQLYTMVCLACHGPNSQGNPDPNIHAPSQVALESWYIQEQFVKFRAGIRGNLKDLEGLRMVPMVRDVLPAMAKGLGATVAEADRDILAYINTLSGKP